MVEDAFLPALPSLVNYYSLESHFFIVYEKISICSFCWKGILKKHFQPREKHHTSTVQAAEDCLLCPETGELGLQDFPQVKFRVSPHIKCELWKSHETNQFRKQVKIPEFLGNWECRDWILPLFAQEISSFRDPWLWKNGLGFFFTCHVLVVSESWKAVTPLDFSLFVPKLSAPVVYWCHGKMRSYSVENSPRESRHTPDTSSRVWILGKTHMGSDCFKAQDKKLVVWGQGEGEGRNAAKECCGLKEKMPEE